MLTAIALLLASIDPLNKPVSLEGEPALLGAVMSELGRQAGIEIKVQGAPERDYVYINVSQRPLRATLDALASACQASWREDAGRVIFSAPWPIQEDSEYEARVAAVQKWLDDNPVPPKLDDKAVREVMEELVRLEQIIDGNDPRRNRIDILKKSLPISRLSLQVLHAMGAKEIAATSNDQKSIYMAQENGHIRALPPQFPQMLDGFRKEAGSFVDSLSAKGFLQTSEEGKLPTTVDVYQFAQFGRLNQAYLSIENRAGALMVILNIVGDDQSAGQVREFTPIRLTPRVQSQDPLLDSFTTLFEPPESWKFLRPLSKPGAWPLESTPELRDRVLNLDADAVLTDYADDVFRQLAQSQAKDVVALIPDASFLMLRSFASSPAALGRVIQQLYERRCIATEESGWLIFRPDEPANSRLDRFPRRESARLLRTLHATGRTPLDQLTAVALASEGYAIEGCLDLAARTFKHPASYSNQTVILRAYGLLSPDQKRDAQASAASIKFGNLTPKLKEVIESMLYGGQLGVMLFGRSDQTPVVYGVHNSAQFILPRGVPDDAAVTFAVKSERALYGLDAEMKGQPVTTTLYALTNSLVAKERGSLRYDLPELFAEEDQGTVELTVVLKDGTKFSGLTRFNGLSHLSRFRKLSEMPKDFRERLQAEMVEAKKRAGERP